MSLLRAANSPTSTYPTTPPHTPVRPPLRVLASGTIFLTHSLVVASYPNAGGVARAQSVRRTRGGHSANVLAVLAQFRGIQGSQLPHHVPSGARIVGEVQFCGPLAGNEEAEIVGRELEAQGVGTRFCTLRAGKGVPAAWVIEAGDGSKTVINHNPLPDMTHDEFVSRMGPVLAPENYEMSPPHTPNPPYAVPTHARKRSGTGPSVHPSPPPNGYALPYNIGGPPFDWMHFEGRAPQTTLANLTGLDGLARERSWRARCVFSLEVSRPGVEALIPHADVIFFPKHYASSLTGIASPRDFLVAMSAHAAPHALLVVDWGAQGAALLSVPTREYMQSSGWVEPLRTGAAEAAGSVRTASGFWADGRPDSGVTVTTSEAGSQWSGTRTPRPEDQPELAEMLDAVGAHEAFVAGMVFALSQRVLPGRPYAPGTGGNGAPPASGRWRLEECLRFATELAGRKGRRAGFGGLRVEMERAGWVVE